MMRKRHQSGCYVPCAQSFLPVIVPEETALLQGFGGTGTPACVNFSSTRKTPHSQEWLCYRCSIRATPRSPRERYAIMAIPVGKIRHARSTPLSARTLNGNAIRDQIYAELKDEIAALGAAGIRPGLAAVLVGENPASKLYVNSKIAACEKLGLASFHLTPPATMTTEELLALVDDLNRRDDVDGILVQMPLPPQIDAKKILDAVSPEKTSTAFIPSTWAS